MNAMHPRKTRNLTGKFTKLEGKSASLRVILLATTFLAWQFFHMSETGESNPFKSLLSETESSASPVLRRSTRARSSPYSTARPIKSMTGIPRTPTAPPAAAAAPQPAHSQETPSNQPQATPLDELKQLMLGLTQKISKIEGAEGRIVKKMDKMKHELSSRVSAVEAEVGNIGRDVVSLNERAENTGRDLADLRANVDESEENLPQLVNKAVKE